jgi:hypothetical protein
MCKISRSESVMNIPIQISESLEFFDADPGSGIFLTVDQGYGIEKLGSRISNTAVF